MKLSRHIVRTIIALIVCALAGMIYLQYRLTLNTIELKETTFRHNVSAALNFANEKLEEIDARNRFFITADSAHAGRHRVPATDSMLTLSTLTLPSGGRSDSFHTRLVTEDLPFGRQRVTVRAFNMLGSIDTVIIDTFTNRAPGDVKLPRNKFSTGAYFVQMKTDSVTSTVRFESGRQSYAYTVDARDIRQARVMKRIAETVGDIVYVPRSRRFSRDLVDSVLTYSLSKQGIAIPFDFGIFSAGTLTLGRTTLPHAELRASEYSLSLTSLEPAPVTEIMTVSFPGYRSYLFVSFLPELGAGIVLTIIIIFCFAYTISIIVRQNTFAARLTDFINNMTHEFKTPLSTISLASEALAKSDVRASDEKVERYNRIIMDEHARMRIQVDKILQMAALEERETEFEKSPLDLHAIIERTAGFFVLAVRSRGGVLTTALTADRTMIEGDALHCENVIRNLVDNAVKYSPAAPDITIRTANEANSIVVTIGDKGIGMAREYHARIFDKYFRIPTGNRHDVKGFGLGLSYVKLVVGAHAGSISIESETGRGTTVTVRFPCMGDQR